MVEAPVGSPSAGVPVVVGKELGSGWCCLRAWVGQRARGGNIRLDMIVRICENQKILIPETQDPVMTAETAVTTARIRGRGQLTLPTEVREALRVGEGDEVEFTRHDDGTVTVRGLKTIPADQAWFWSPDWQAGERE